MNNFSKYILYIVLIFFIQISILAGDCEKIYSDIRVVTEVGDVVGHELLIKIVDKKIHGYLKVYEGGSPSTFELIGHCVGKNSIEMTSIDPGKVKLNAQLNRLELFGYIIFNGEQRIKVRLKASDKTYKP